MNRETEFYENDAFLVKKLGNGIVLNEIKENAVIDFGILMEMKEINKYFAEHKPYCLLVKTHPTSELTKDARDELNSVNIIEQRIAKAIVISSPAQKLIYDVFTIFHKGRINSKLFTDYHKALDWLKKEYQNQA